MSDTGAPTFCRNCAAAIHSRAAVCTQCGVLTSGGSGYCPNCGKAHDKNADFCTGCGKALSSLARGQAAPAAPGILIGTANTAFAFTDQAPGNAIPEPLLARWSWGGFLLGFLWVFWNGNTTLKWINVICYVLGFFTLGLSSLALAIYFGIKGNRIAARDRRFASIDQFVAVQRAWAKAGVIVLVVSAVVIPIVTVFGALLLAALGIAARQNG